MGIFSSDEFGYSDWKEEHQKVMKYKKALKEIKPILELYANSKVGEEQSDGTYILSGGIWGSFGFCTTTYDPRPARQALQKINECEVE